jgi:hypothetical protein
VYEAFARRNQFFPDGRVSSQARRNIVVSDEFVADVNGSVSFVATGFNLNPGQVGTFPRLSREAVLYEKYRFLMVEFYFKPMVSGFATNGQVGKIMLSFDADASDPPPASKQQVEDTDPHADAMPYQDVTLEIPKSLLKTNNDAYFVRPAGVPGGSDIKTYDIGVLYASTVACANTTAIGELRIRYALELSVPILEGTTTPSVNYSTANFRSTTAEAGGATGVAATMLLATTVVNGIGAVNAAGTITLATGNYLVFATVDESNTGANITGAVLQLLLNGVAQTVSPVETTAGVTSQTQAGSWYVTSNGSSTIAMTVTVTYAAGVQTNLGSLIIYSV